MFEHLPMRRIRDLRVQITFRSGENSHLFFHTLHRRMARAGARDPQRGDPQRRSLVHVDAPDAFAAAVCRATTRPSPLGADQ